jgi:hypothetical protein
MLLGSPLAAGVPRSPIERLLPALPQYVRRVVFECTQDAAAALGLLLVSSFVSAKPTALESRPDTIDGRSLDVTGKWPLSVVSVDARNMPKTTFTI